MKVRLEKRRRHWMQVEDPLGSIPVTQCLPFFQGHTKGYVHRVRHAMMHFRDGVYSHMSVQAWCGQGSFISKQKSTLHEDPPENSYMCATCEGRAIGAGQVGSREIAGREVMFRPRESKGSGDGQEINT